MLRTAYTFAAMVEKVYAENKQPSSVKQAEQPRSEKPRPDHVAPPESSSKVPADILWPPDQKELIDTVERYLHQMQEWRNAGSSARRLSVAPTLLVLGDPGNGKTTKSQMELLVKSTELLLDRAKQTHCISAGSTKGITRLLTFLPATCLCILLHQQRQP